MLTVTKDKPIATTTTGALPRPAWFTGGLGGRPFSVAMADRQFREQYIDAQAALILDQKRAGIHILVDGDARLDDGFAGRHWIA